MIRVIFKWIVVISYFLGACYFAYRGERRKHDRWIAGREGGYGLLELARAGGAIGPAAIIGFGGLSSLFGLSLLWMAFFCILCGVFIAFVFLGKRTRLMGIALNAYTFPEVLGVRYQSPFIQGCSAIILGASIPLFAGGIIVGVSRLIEVFLHIPYLVSLVGFAIFLLVSVLFGGFERGEWYSFSLLFLVLCILCAWVYWALGGVTPAHQALTAIASFVPIRLLEGGLEGWSAGLRLGSPFWWIAFSSMILGVGIGSLVQPLLVAGLLRARSEEVMDGGVAVVGIFVLAMVSVPLVVGPLSNTLFVERFGMISIAAAEGNVDKVIPLFVDTIMPWWFAPLFIVGMLAASSSILQALFRLGGTCLGRDLFANWGGLRRGGEARATRLGVVLTLCSGVIWGVVLPPSSVAVVTSLFFSLSAACFLSPYLLGLYWKGVTREGGVAGIVGGACSTLLWLSLFHDLGPTPILSLAKGGMERHWALALAYVDPVCISLPISLALSILVSHRTRKLPTAHLRRCFRYIDR